MTPNRLDFSNATFNDLAECGIALGLIGHYGADIRFTSNEEILTQAKVQASIYKAGVPDLAVNPANVLSWVRYFESTLTENEFQDFNKIAENFKRQTGVKP